MAAHDRPGDLTRREFGVLTAGALIGSAAHLDAQGVARTLPSPSTGGAILDIAEWSYYWYGVERVMLARGTLINGSQMFVEHWIPAQVRHSYSIVLIHGGYGQGSDWLSTPDGRRGWASLLIEEGYRVYVVDRPGQGRNPHHPWVHGLYDAQAPTFSRVAQTIGHTSAAHTQWPGTGDENDPAIAQVAAAMGQPMANNEITQNLWRSRGAILLDDIGPSILITHGDGATFAYVTAQARPSLVKAIVTVEQPPQSLQGQRLADLRTIPIAIVTADASAGNDPKAADLLRQSGWTVESIALASHGIRGNGPMVMMEKNNRAALQPVLEWMRSIESGTSSPPSAVGPQRVPQAARDVEIARNTESMAVRLADQGGFFVGIKRKPMPYGAIPQGQMFVQYMIPAAQRYPYPIVMVHGGGGQGTHMMGLGRRPGWVHYFVQTGYAVYWLDRPSYGRSPYHPDALGPGHLPNVPPYEPLLEATNVFKTGQWPGPGGMEDPYINQFMACESGNTSDEAFHSDLVWPGGVELIDRIGPCILHGHAFGGFFAWGVADRRPNLVKGIVCMEINGNPFERQLRWGLTASPMTYDPPVTDVKQFRLVDRTPPPDSPRPIASPFKLQAEPAHKWKNLSGIPIAWLTSEFGAGGSPVANVEFLEQVGCKVEMLRLLDHGITGNGNLMLMERNNHEVFTVLRDWLDKNVAPPKRT
ncbi:MAG TPA: alpha/beta fold hydrolase [Vicinamibacterales bacterium]|jgi:pimeloyl-ACP methyl ester carboxylesterase